MENCIKMSMTTCLRDGSISEKSISEKRAMDFEYNMCLSCL